MNIQQKLSLIVIPIFKRGSETDSCLMIETPNIRRFLKESYDGFRRGEYKRMYDRETKEIKQKNLRANDFKGFIRKIEGLVEVIIFVLIYYFAWKWAYRGEDFPNYYGNGKYLLALVYAFLVFVFFLSL